MEKEGEGWERGGGEQQEWSVEIKNNNKKCMIVVKRKQIYETEDEKRRKISIIWKQK